MPRINRRLPVSFRDRFNAAVELSCAACGCLVVVIVLLELMLWATGHR